MFAQYYPRKMVYLDRKEKARDGNSYSVFELANCQKCAQEYLVGKSNHKNGGLILFRPAVQKSLSIYLFLMKIRC